MFKSVNGKMGRMRKAVDWVVCPVSNLEPNEIIIQSDRYIAKFNSETNKVILSDGKGGHPGFHKLTEFCGAKEIDAPQWLIDQLVEIDVPKGPVKLT